METSTTSHGAHDYSDLERARGWLANARNVLILTGAGISVESGIPPFRGPNGIWTEDDKRALCSLAGFDANPCKVWEFYENRRLQALSVQPNAAHRAIAQYAQSRSGVHLVTQNVDGLHHRAAMNVGDAVGAEAIIDMHGGLFRAICRRCQGVAREYPRLDLTSRKTLPTCQWCHKFLRPDIVWFGERIPEKKRFAATRAGRIADVCLVIGTTLEVYPAADLPDEVRAHGGDVIEVNPRPVVAPRVRTDNAGLIAFAGKAGDVVPLLVR